MKRRVGWVAVAAGVVLTATGLVPARATAGTGAAGVTAGSPASTTTTTATTGPSTTTTTTTAPTGSGPTTTTIAPTGSGSTATTTAPTGSGSTTTATGATTSSSTTMPAATGTSGTTTTRTSPGADPPGTLSISAPDLTNLGATGGRGRVVAARLGTVMVTDTRGVVDGAWTVRVSATPFAPGGGSGGQRLAGSAIRYWSGPVTARSGTARLVPGQPGPADAVPLTSTRVAFSATGVTGRNSASWVPTVVIRVPQAAVAGRYRGAIIHSVA
jgi:hypothetical protein